jgi:DNA adenine methylase
LKEKIDETFHSRAQHTEAGQVYTLEDENTLEIAWSVWVQTNMSFSSMIGAGFGYDRNGKCPLKLFNKEAFTEAYKERLKKVTIESNDVLKVIKAYDSPDAFFYLDPPYVSANQGHYSGYTESDFRALLDVCSQIKGKFLLSTYPEEILLEEYIPKFGWNHEQHEKTLAVDGRRKANKKKVECLTFNY